MLILEIAAGIFLGLFAFWSFLAWRSGRQAERKLESQLAGLTTDQLKMLRGVHDQSEFDRMVSNMHDSNRRDAEWQRQRSQISN